MQIDFELVDLVLRSSVKHSDTQPCGATVGPHWLRSGIYFACLAAPGLGRKVRLCVRAGTASLPARRPLTNLVYDVEPDTSHTRRYRSPLITRSVTLVFAVYA